MKLGYVSLVVSCGIALAGCAPFAGNGFLRTSTTFGTCDDSGVRPCKVQVRVLPGSKCTLTVTPDWLKVQGKLGVPLPITWELMTPDYEFPKAVGVIFADPQFSNQTYDPKSFVVSDGNRTYGWFKYTVNVIGADGLSYCTPLDPWINNY